MSSFASRPALYDGCRPAINDSGLWKQVFITFTPGHTIAWLGLSRARGELQRLELIVALIGLDPASPSRCSQQNAASETWFLDRCNWTDPQVEQSPPIYPHTPLFPPSSAYLPLRFRQCQLVPSFESGVFGSLAVACPRFVHSRQKLRVETPRLD